MLDIQRIARKNVNTYKKGVNEILKMKQFIVNQNKVDSTLSKLEKKFKYYRLSLYTFFLVSHLEIMLSDNFREGYISGIKDEIRIMSQIYRNLFGECSVHLEKITNSTLEKML